jgi:hypothetical protein
MRFQLKIAFYLPVSNLYRVIVRSCMLVIGYSESVQNENTHNVAGVTVIVYLSMVSFAMNFWRLGFYGIF